MNADCLGDALALTWTLRRRANADPSRSPSLASPSRASPSRPSPPLSSVALSRMAEAPRRRMGLYPPLPNFKKNLVYGGTAGLVGAVCMFPVDTAKTRVQNEKVAPGQKRMYENISSALRTIYRTQGLRGLYNGLQVTGRRAGSAADGRKRARALGEPQRKRASKGHGARTRRSRRRGLGRDVELDARPTKDVPPTRPCAEYHAYPASHRWPARWLANPAFYLVVPLCRFNRSGSSRRRRSSCP